MCTWIEFIIGMVKDIALKFSSGMVIDTGLKVLAAASALMTITLGSR